MIELTEKEQEDAGRVMLVAALAELSKLGKPPGNIDVNTIAAGVIKAFVAARKAGEKEQERLEAIKGESVYHHMEFDLQEVIATAFWLWSEDIDLDINDVHPASVAGNLYLGFAQALSASWAITEAINLMSGAGFYSDGTSATNLLKIIEND